MEGWSLTAHALACDCNLNVHEARNAILSKRAFKTSNITTSEVVDLLEERKSGPRPRPAKLSLAFERVPARAYQLDVLMKARRKSGFIVAPCGSGKTLMGCMLAMNNGGRCIILTTRYAEQWKDTLLRFFDTSHLKIVMCTSKHNPAPGSFPDVIIATYCAWKTRCTSWQRALRQLLFTTVVLDEAHGAASSTNMTAIAALHSQYVLALTATKVREDDELEKLESYIGKTIVTVDRDELVRNGFVAPVKCVNLLVEYDSRIEGIVDMKVSLAIHPYKMQVLRSTLRKLEEEMHKTIVFCDDLFCLKWTFDAMRAASLNAVGSISMRTHSQERANLLRKFEMEPGPMTLFLSRTGDEALDVPAASAGVMFWNHWASRRQIVQRVGRLTRVCSGKKDAIFIVLLSNAESELQVSRHREAYMKEHGFDVRTFDQGETTYGTRLIAKTAKYESALRHRCRTKRKRAAFSAGF